MKFLGCVDDVTEGILAGYWDNDDWVLEVNSSFVPHGNVSEDAGHDAAQNQEESTAASASRGGERPANQEEFKGSAGSSGSTALPTYAQDAIFDFAAEQTPAQEEC